MPNEDKNIGGSLVLDLRIWWRHVKTLYKITQLHQSFRHQLQGSPIGAEFNINYIVTLVSKMIAPSLRFRGIGKEDLY